MKIVDTQFFPGWVRKSVTFTIDDGNIPLDRKFMDIVKPAGIRGTFNLNTPLKRLTPEEYREFYRGYEIANHCEHHPKLWDRQKYPRELKQELFCKETADPSYMYPGTDPGLIHVYDERGRWQKMALDCESYLSFAKKAQEELESVFGKGAIKDFVWPYCEQNDPALLQGLIGMGFRSIRKTGCVKDATSFALPQNRMAWSYNAHDTDLEEVSALYKALPDDGALKFFCFGVHSHDFENRNSWNVLEDFCKEFGNRPNEYWYASVGEIFDYEDAVRALAVTEEAVINHSEIDLYVKIDGEPVVIKAHTQYGF